jgi:hypothetical protein
VNGRSLPRIPACSGYCHGARLPCPHPQHCHLAASDDDAADTPDDGLDVWRGLASLLRFYAVLGVVLLALHLVVSL